MAGRHINDHQVRLFMTNRRNAPVALAAAKAGFSTATGYRLLQSGELPSQRQSARSRRRPDPLAGIFEEIVVPMLYQPAVSLTHVGDSQAARSLNL